MQIIDLTEYEILKIAQYLDRNSANNMRQSCRSIKTTLENNRHIIHQVIWIPIQEKLNEKRSHIMITPLMKFIQWTYDGSTNQAKVKLAETLIRTELNIIQRILEARPGKEVTPYPVPQYIRGRIRDELIDLHIKLRYRCDKVYKEHTQDTSKYTHTPIPKGNPLCDMENVIYKYIRDLSTPQILPTYILILINNTNILSAEKDLTQHISREKEPFIDWLQERLYLFEDEYYPDRFTGKWPPDISNSVATILAYITGA